jgi:hypothetical protein
LKKTPRGVLPYGTSIVTARRSWFNHLIACAIWRWRSTILLTCFLTRNHIMKSLWANFVSLYIYTASVLITDGLFTSAVVPSVEFLAKFKVRLWLNWLKVFVQKHINYGWKEEKITVHQFIFRHHNM